MAALGWLLPERRGAVLSSDMERSHISSYFAGETGVFVEVGAFDPIYQSQSYHLEIMGWDGVLVEPLPEQAEGLRSRRKSMVFELACVAPEMAGKRAPLLSQRGFSTLHFNPSKTPAANVIEVATATLDDVLARAGVTHVDFLSVDVEGGEPDVLRGFNFQRYKPRLVLVDDSDRFSRTCQIMARNRYKLVRRTGHNAWFVPRQARFSAGNFAGLQLGWTYGPGRMLRRMRAWIHGYPTSGSSRLR